MVSFSFEKVHFRDELLSAESLWTMRPTEYRRSLIKCDVLLSFRALLCCLKTAFLSSSFVAALLMLLLLIPSFRPRRWFEDGPIVNPIVPRSDDDATTEDNARLVVVVVVVVVVVNAVLRTIVVNVIIIALCRSIAQKVVFIGPPCVANPILLELK